ncbi:MAG: mechanosensitive ion channel [Anaerolineae bacterium]|nr:mechanosensitive ion channel [Anaerolineae bacterium]
MTDTITVFLEQYPLLTVIGALVIIVLSYFITSRLIVNLIVKIATRTENKYDDVVIKHIKPRRLSLAVPLIIASYFINFLPEDTQRPLQVIVLLGALWLAIITLNKIFDAINEIYESSPSFTGESIEGYMDLVKILAICVGVILSISLVTGKSAAGLLTGLGAITAVLMLVFQSTILSLVASFQINANDLVKIGDWLEVPDYQADGDVVDITLHQIKIQNWDNTISVVPTHKMLEVAYKNWRGMKESGGRRIKRSLYIDQSSIRHCTDEMIERFRCYELIQDYVDEKMAEIEQWNAEHGVDAGTLVNARRMTNIGTFRVYVNEYLKSRPELRQDMTMMARQLAPGPQGLPIEIYAFTNTTVWAEYEEIQANLFDRLLAIVPEFDLRIYQEPSGGDFAGVFRRE